MIQACAGSPDEMRGTYLLDHTAHPLYQEARSGPALGVLGLERECGFVDTQSSTA